MKALLCVNSVTANWQRMVTSRPKAHKLDIFRVLSRVDAKDTKFYDGLSDEEQKAFQPLVVMKWLSGTSDARQVYFLNEFLNPFIFSIPNHKQLLYQLMTICNSGKSRRYKWNKAKPKQSSKMPETIKVIQDTFRYSAKHSEDALPMLTNDDILEYAGHLGRQKDEISKIKKELKGR